MSSTVKTSRVQSPGHCVFCGRTGLSKQHMWGKRLEKIIPRDQIYHQQLLTEMQLNPSHLEVRPGIKERQGSVHARQLRIVCGKHCNSGWMRQLEEAAYDFLPRLIQGEDFDLTAEQQRTLAAWFAQFVIIAEFTDIPRIAVTRDERTYLMEHCEAPKNWQLWIGRYEDTYWSPLRYYHVGARLGTASDIGQDGPCNIQSTTVVIGNMALHAVSTTVNDLFLSGLTEDFVPEMCSFWPNPKASLRTSGLPVLGDKPLLEIANRLLMVGSGAPT